MISDKAIIQSDKIGNNVTIMENVIVRSDVIIGDNVIIHPNVIIEDGAHIGNNTEIFSGTLIGKEPKGSGALTRPINYVKIIIIGENCSVGPNAVIYCDVQIGNNTLIGDGASIREKVRIGNQCLIGRYVTINYNSVIGNQTKIMDLTHITGNCNIGKNVFISIHVSTVNDNVVVNRTYSEDDIIGPTIADNSTIGANAIILPKVRIGVSSMVAAGSIVTKDVRDHILVLGAPAKEIRTL